MTAAPSLGPRRRFSRTGLLLASCVAFALLAVGSAALASTERWEPYPPGVGGPWGGSVRALVSPADFANLFDPRWSTLYAATGGGVFASADGGLTWVPRNEGLQSLDVTDICACPADPWRLIASTATQGVHLSGDGGLTWVRVPQAAMLSRDRFWRAAVRPTDPLHLFAATFSGSPDILLESRDGGTTWTRVGGADGAYAVSRLRFTRDGASLYFSTKTGRIFRYSFTGNPLALPAFPGSPSAEIIDFALPGGDGSVIAAAQGGVGLWVSQNSGSSWTESHFAGTANPEFHEVDAVGWDPLNPARLLYRLNDPLAGAATALYELPLAGTRTALPLPELGMELEGIFVSPAAEWLLEAKAGVFRRTGRSAGFVHSSRGLAAYSARDLAFGPTPGVVAVAGGAFGSGNGGAYRWDSLGAQWLRFAAKPTDLAGSSFPAASTLLVRYRGEELWLGVDGWGLYRSLDGGQTWEDRNFGLGTQAKRGISGLEFSPENPSRVIAGTQAGVYSTSDSGATWSAASEIPPTIGWAVARDAGSSSVFFAGGPQSNDGLFFRTENAGVSWEQPAAGSFAGMQIKTLAASPGHAGHVLAGTRFFSLFETRDGGNTWEALGAGESGLPGFGEVNAVAIGEQAGDPWMAAVVNRSVFLTLDGGGSWVQRDQGLAVTGNGVHLIYALRFQPGAARLVAAVDGRGLWYLDLFPRAELSGVPAALTTSRSATVQVGGSEIAAYRWSLDGAPYSGEAPVSQAISLSGLTDGIHRLEVVGRNASGAWQPTEAATAAQWTVDATPPTGSIAIAGGAASTPSVSVTLDLPASDGAGSGVTEMRVANGAPPSGAWSAYQASRSWVLPPGDGEKVVYAQFRDAAGNASAVVSDTILLDGTAADTQAPTGSLALAGGAAFTASTTVALTLAAADDSGTVAQMRVANGASPASAPWVAYAAILTWTLSAGDGEKTVSAQFRDAAGNVSAVVSDTIVLDATPPSGSVQLNGGAAATASASVSLSLAASDGSGSGVAEMRAANGASPSAAPWVSYAATLAWMLPAGDGTKTVSVQFRDAAGNASALATASILQDTTPPSVGATPPGGTYAAAQSVTLAAGEPATIYYTLDGSAPTTSSLSGPSPLAVEVSESGTLRYFGVDAAGNSGAVASQAYVIQAPPDTTPPQVSVANPGGAYSGPVTVTLQANEAATIYYTLDGSEPTEQSARYVGPIAIAESAVLRYFAVDASGNRSPVYSQTYTITPAAGGDGGGGGGGGGCFLSALGK